jgi:TonB family protein
LKNSFVIFALLSLSNVQAFAQGQGTVCGIGEENLRPLLETHTLPPYPVESFRQKEEGTVLMQITIRADGVPTGVTTEKSSGFPRLDEAASVWVQKQYRWQPFHGKCAAIVTRLSVKWDLHGASLYSTLYPQQIRATPYEGDAITELLLNHH